MPLPPLPIDYKLGTCTVLHVLGQGSCGVTYLVADPRQADGVAVIKEFLPAELAFRDEATKQVLPREVSAEGVEKLRTAQESFTAESEALMGLHHRSVAEVYRVFRALGTTYVAMECVQGLTVAEWRARNGRPTREQVVFLLRALLSALNALHSHKLVHGDLREEHVRFRKDGTPVLLDFGVARQTLLAEGKTSVLTDFKSPSADLFALGAMMRRLVTGTDVASTGRVTPLEQDSALVSAYGRSVLAGIDKAMNPNAGKGWRDAEAWLDSLSGRLLSREARRRCKLAFSGLAALLVLGAGVAWTVNVISERMEEQKIVNLTPEQKAEAAFAKAKYMLETAPAVLAPDGTVQEPARPDKAASLACMLEAASFGHPDAPWQLVTYYTEGIGCEPNPAEVFHWCEVAAKKQNPEALYLLARLYHEGKGTPTDDQTANDAAAIPFLKSAAAEGLRDAQYDLAQCYAAGRGLYADPEEAVHWLAAAGEQGDVRAQMELGRRYKESDGVLMNHQESFKWYNKAAEAGNAEAWYRIGLAYLEGSGTERDTAKGADCLREAGKLGVEKALYRLGHDIVEGNIPDASLDEAAASLKQAADKGMTEAQWELAEFYARGKGGEPDLQAAYPYYHLAAKGGHVSATLALAEAYLSGHSELPCDAEALRGLLEKAVEANNATAMLYAGLMLDNAPDKKKEMLQKAASAGAADAYVYLGMMQTDAEEEERAYQNAAAKRSAFGESMLDFCALRKGATGDQAQAALSGLKRAAERDSFHRGYVLLALADVYANGWGTEKDDAQAQEYLTQAADAGNVQAICRLAAMCEQGADGAPDAAAAEKLYLRAEQAGSAEAAYRLGLLREKAGAADAAEHFRKAAAAWQRDAMFRIAQTTGDKEESSRLYRELAESGYVPAMPYLSRMYETGEGVEGADAQKAFKYLYDAKAAGVEDGDVWDRLGTFYNTGFGVSEDKAEAQDCWRKAAELKSVSGMYHYAVSCNEDGYPRKSADVALRWLREASAAGSAEATDYMAKVKRPEATKTTPRRPSSSSSRGSRRRR